jgi:uncharacterized protein YejL (UPF0352 family)
MKHKFSLSELKQIRKAIEAVLDKHEGNDVLYVSIILPHECSVLTSEFAQQLAVALTNVNCRATISSLLSFSGAIPSGKPYEVLRYIPIASPCIRVYEQKHYRPGRLSLVRSVRNWIRFRVVSMIRLITLE